MPAAPLILASASPRRAELLAQLKIPFEVVTSHAPEIEDESLPPGELATRNALLKARAVQRLHPERLILGADTVVALGSRHFAKPRDLAHAAEMLHALQGRTHQVVTGVALLNERENLFHETTEVTFRPLAADQITEYLARVHVLDKAGAYAIQEHGDLIIQSISGSYSNVVGLPLEKLAAFLDVNFAPRA